MSILIKGMEMPKSCFDCPCHHHKVDDGYYDYEICGASGTVFNDGYSSVTGHKDHINPFKARLDNCPLISVPKHGRLIDADAFESIKYELPNGQKSFNRGFHSGVQYVQRLIMNAPTIIPAEGGET